MQRARKLSVDECEFSEKSRRRTFIEDIWGCAAAAARTVGAKKYDVVDSDAKGDNRPIFQRFSGARVEGDIGEESCNKHIAFVVWNRLRQFPSRRVRDVA